MKVCPSCGKEYPDEVDYCIDCGTLLEPKTGPPRDKLTENIRYAVNVAKSNPKIFLPQIAIIITPFIFFLLFALTTGLNFSFIKNLADSNMTALSGGVLLFASIIPISMLCVGVLSIPFIQKIYYDATVGEEISFRESFRYAMSRFFTFLGAELVFVLIMLPVTFIWAYTLPVEAYMPYEEFSYAVFWRFVWGIVLLSPFVVVYFLSLLIMTWDNVGLGVAVRASYEFVKSRLVKLVVLFVIETVMGGVMMFIPFGMIISYVTGVILNIALIDIYLNYQKSKDIDLTPIMTI